jgi:hypothetical protein
MRHQTYDHLNLEGRIGRLNVDDARPLVDERGMLRFTGYLRLRHAHRVRTLAALARDEHPIVGATWSAGFLDQRNEWAEQLLNALGCGSRQLDVHAKTRQNVRSVLRDKSDAIGSGEH